MAWTMICKGLAILTLLGLIHEARHGWRRP